MPVFFHVTKVPEEINSTSLPTTFIINKDGAIVANKVGAADWNSEKVRSLLDLQLQ